LPLLAPALACCVALIAPTKCKTSSINTGLVRVAALAVLGFLIIFTRI
jgi:hypothetical protein